MEDTGGIDPVLWATLEEVARPARERRRLEPRARDDIILGLCSGAPLSVRQLSQLLNRTESYTGDAIRPLIESGRVTYIYPDQPRHPRQRYVVPGSPASLFVDPAAKTTVAADTSVPDDEAERNAELVAREALASTLWPELERAAILARERRRLSPEIRDDLVVNLCQIAPLSAKELATLMARSEAYIADALQPLVRDGRLIFLYPSQPRHPRQKYLSSRPLEDKPAALSVMSSAAAQDPLPSPITAQERWIELEDAARPARENRYLGGVEFADLVEVLATIAPVSPREVAILTDRREEYIRQVLDDMTGGKRLTLLVDESLGSRRNKYQAAHPSRSVVIRDVPSPASTIPLRAGGQASAPPGQPASAPAAGSASTSRGGDTSAHRRPADGPDREVGKRPPVVRPEPAPRPTPQVPAPALVASLPSSAAIPASSAGADSPRGPGADLATGTDDRAAGREATAPRESRGLLNPTTNLVSAVITGLVLGVLDPATWWAYALVVATLFATLHIITDSTQYRRYRNLNPRRDRKVTFWVLKLLISLTEIVAVYAASSWL